MSLLPSLSFDIMARDRTGGAFSSLAKEVRQADTAIAAVDKTLFGVANRMQALSSGRMKQQLGFQLNDIAVSLSGGMNPLMVMMQQGTQITQLYAGQGGVTQAIKDTGSMVLGLATKFPLLTAAVGVTGLAFAEMRSEIEGSTGVAVTFGDVAGAAMSVVGSKIHEVLNPAIDLIAPWFQSAWTSVVSFTHDFTNNIIRLVLGSFELIKFGVMQLPNAFIVAGEAAANGFLSSITVMVRETVATINGLVADINGALLKSGIESFQLSDIGTPVRMFPDPQKMDFGGAAAAKEMSAAWSAVNASVDAIMAKDYAGSFFDAVKQQALANAAERTADATGGIGKAGRKAGDDAASGAKKAGDAWAGLRKVTEDVGKGISEAMTFGKDTLKGFFSEVEAGIQQGKGLWKSLGDAAISALQKIADKAFDMAIDGIFSGSGSGGWLSSIFGSLFGGGGGFSATTTLTDLIGGTGMKFANGGSFQVGGAGGIDSQLVSFKATPNETVTVSTPSQAANQNGSASVTNHFHIDARGAVEGTAEQIRRALKDYDSFVAPKTAVNSLQKYRKAGGNI